MEEKDVYINVLITGMFLQISCSMISVSRAYPDIEGRSTSVNIKSTLSGFPFSISQAFKPSGTAATDQYTKPNHINTNPFSLL